MVIAPKADERPALHVAVHTAAIVVMDRVLTHILLIILQEIVEVVAVDLAAVQNPVGLKQVLLCYIPLLR